MLHIAAASLLVCVGAIPPAPPREPVTVAAVGEVESVAFEGRASWSFGGMSGIDHIGSGVYYIICDDRAKIDPARRARVPITIDDGAIEMGPVWWSELRDEFGRAFGRNEVDPESVRKMPYEIHERFDVAGFVWSSEGRVKDDIAPAIYIRHSSMRVDRIEIPDAYRPDTSDADAQTRGVRHNRGFEAIGVRGVTLLAAPEMALTQDERPGMTRGRQFIRVQSFAFDGETYRPTRQAAYPHGPNRAGFDAGPKNGVTSLLALDDDRWLVLERGEPESGDSYDIRLYLCDASEADDLSAIDALGPLARAQLPVLARKELVLDFETVRDELPGGRVPNFEGMSFTPTPGRVLLIADNDHGEDGPTVLAAIDLPASVLE